MSISRGELNPLGVLELRKLSFVPEHFAKIAVSLQVDSRSIEKWIVTNLNSRYAFQKKFKINQDKKIITMIEIGLEDPKEITMLTLGCQYLYKERTF